MAALLQEVAPAPPPGLKVTGSNGKGSTCAIAASILRAHGLRVGLYTSPHLIQANERIVLDGAPIPDAALARWIDRVLAVADGLDRGAYSAFELWTAVAAGWLSEQRADVVVWEAGIGGSLDPVRLLPATVSVITSVSLEHTALLGDDRAAIARDKAGIADEGSFLVVGPDVPGFPQTHACEAVCSVSMAPLALPGPHQRDNARCAVIACEALLGVRFEPAAAERGLAAVRWAGRFERVADTPPVWVDVAHNEAGLAQVAATAREVLGDAPIVLVLGVSADRPYQRMVPIVAPLAAAIVCTVARHKGAPPQDIAAQCPGQPRVVTSVEEAMPIALEIARGLGGAVLVTGGLFLVAEAVVALRGDDPSLLRW